MSGVISNVWMLFVLIAILSFVVVLILTLAPGISAFNALVNSIVPDSTINILSPVFNIPPTSSFTL